jgi:hypothetical protein
MWRKITSNRDPRDTIYSELKKEFSPYVGKANDYGRHIAERFPNFLFGIMVALIVLSTALSFTVFRHHHPVRQPAPVTKAQSPIQDGFSQIMETAGKIRQTLRLKNLVDSITAKKQLTSADSTLLDSALDQLQRLHSSQIKRGQP